ncbi:MAG: pyridoxal-phosphate dependent enzyme [Alphaproteobacteria bacterium]|nr:pyridoxal-phosphate dependent enzyme [Alphaproteobacteria bacterium]
MAAGETLPTLRGVEAAFARIRSFVPETPLVRAELLSRLLGCDLWLKNEGATATFSFKLRGAANDLLQARASDSLKGIVASSSGNHGLAVAWVARTLGRPAHVFVSTQVGPRKRHLIEMMGARVHAVGADVDYARAAAIDYAGANGFYFVNDGVSLDLMEGAGTMALEIAQRLPDVDAILVNVGGGNLAAATAVTMQALQPKTKVIGVAPDASPVIADSFRQRRALVIPPRETVADALAQRETVAFSLSVLWKYLADAWLVDDATILSAQRALLESAHMLAEPSGVACLAAAWTHREELRGKRIVLAITGANATVAQIQRALAAPPLA